MDGFYENNLDCTWVIWSDDIANRVVQIYFNNLDIPSRDGCKDDYLEVRHTPITFLYNATTLKIGLIKGASDVNFSCVL